ncbi:hypothetical protein BDS110ZK4_77760 [Bradyrhizobium diazoefficiens]|nr:hypothetical protein BJA01nite_48860 [Bradyrhizobium japonicum]
MIDIKDSSKVRATRSPACRIPRTEYPPRLTAIALIARQKHKIAIRIDPRAETKREKQAVTD